MIPYVNEDGDIRFVHHEEQPDEIAVRELGRARAMCMCRVQFGRCRLRECATCKTGIGFRECYNQLNDYNRTRLSNYITAYYRKYSLYPESWMSYKRLIKRTVLWMSLLLITILLPLLAIYMLEPNDKPIGGVPVETDNKILTCLKYTQDNIYDRNLDCKVNCIDYAVTFKEQWDRMYPGSKRKCILVRNKGPRMHHLFACVYYDGGYVFVETWASDYRYYHMEQNWDSRYNPKYNIYTETDKWMMEIIR